MTYVRGGDLYMHLAMNQTLSEEICRFFIAQLALALAYIHSFNIVYRDLKLENVLLDENGYLVLIDFGVAKFIGETREPTFSVRGTPEYLAPEMIE